MPDPVPREAHLAPTGSRQGLTSGTRKGTYLHIYMLDLGCCVSSGCNRRKRVRGGMGARW